MSAAVWKPLSICAILIFTFGFCEGSIQFFHISDVHFDPWYDPTLTPETLCRPVDPPKNVLGLADPFTTLENKHSTFDEYVAFGKLGCDAPPLLLQETIKAMRHVNPRPEYLLVTGDFAAHRLSWWGDVYILKAIEIMSKKLVAAFPESSFIPALGNNDMCPHYSLTCDDVWLQRIYELWAPLVPALREKENKRSFLRGGYYVVHTKKKLRVIVLNTVYYSMQASPPQSAADPCGQFEWFKAQLESAKHAKEKVYVISHVPPGISVKREITMGDAEQLWHDYYTVAYQTLSLAYADTIAGQFYGHTHRDEFRLLPPFTLAAAPDWNLVTGDHDVMSAASNSNSNSN
eukprot:Rmarinus@m.23034